MAVAGLVSFGRRGMALSSVGREVLARIRHDGGSSAKERRFSLESAAATGAPGLVAVHGDRNANDSGSARRPKLRIGQLRQHRNTEILALAA